MNYFTKEKNRVVYRTSQNKGRNQSTLETEIIIYKMQDTIFCHSNFIYYKI